jgi:biopolymer transport protein ExbB
MKKSGLFSAILIVVALIASALIYFLVFGNPANFKDPTKSSPANLLGSAYLGGVVLIALMTVSIMVITYAVERGLSLGKAKGKGDVSVFLKNVQNTLRDGDLEGAIAVCDKQKGSIANVIRQGLVAYQVATVDKSLNEEQKLAEVRTAIEEAMGLELPLLNKNMSALATLASISVLIGLFGTVTGMIKSFSALATAGTPNAAELSAGISEALFNTAFGLFGAVIGTIFYNFFLTMIGNLTYMMDEATYNILAVLAIKKD